MCRLASLRISTRHEFRGPASLFTGKEAEFNKVGLFSTNKCASSSLLPSSGISVTVLALMPPSDMHPKYWTTSQNIVKF